MTIGLEEIKDHVGHEIACVVYGKGQNYAIECETCGMVLFDSDENVFMSFYTSVDNFKRYYHTCEDHAKKLAWETIRHIIEVEL